MSIWIITQSKEKRKNSIKTCSGCRAAEGSIDKFIREKVKDKFIKELKYGIKGLLGVTTLDFIIYTKDRWGELHTTDITTIQDKMKDLFNIPKGIAV